MDILTASRNFQEYAQFISYQKTFSLHNNSDSVKGQSTAVPAIMVLSCKKTGKGITAFRSPCAAVLQCFTAALRSLTHAILQRPALQNPL